MDWGQELRRRGRETRELQKRSGRDSCQVLLAKGVRRRGLRAWQGTLYLSGIRLGSWPRQAGPAQRQARQNEERSLRGPGRCQDSMHTCQNSSICSRYIAHNKSHATIIRRAPPCLMKFHGELCQSGRHIRDPQLLFCRLPPSLPHIWLQRSAPISAAQAGSAFA
jgi:hypothetical protein